MINVQYESLDFRKSSFGQLQFFLSTVFHYETTLSTVFHTPGKPYSRFVAPPPSVTEAVDH